MHNGKSTVVCRNLRGDFQQNNASVDWSYFVQKCTKFHLQPSRCEKLRTPAYKNGERKGRGRPEWIKMFLPLKEGEERKRRRKGKRKEKGKGGRGEGKRPGGSSAAKVLKRDRRRCIHPLSKMRKNVLTCRTKLSFYATVGAIGLCAAIFLNCMLLLFIVYQADKLRNRNG